MYCPACSGQEWEFYSEWPHGENRKYVQCATCGDGVVRLDPLITFEDSLSLNLYDEKYHKDMQSRRSGVRIKDFEAYGLDNLETFLELGPGGDALCSYLIGKGKTVDAVEINKSSLQHLRSIGVGAVMTYQDLGSLDRYDLAASYHYLEHVANPALDLSLQAMLARKILLHMPVGLDEIGNSDHNWLMSPDCVEKMVLKHTGGCIVKSEYRDYGKGPNPFSGRSMCKALQIVVEVG